MFFKIIRNLFAVLIVFFSFTLASCCFTLKVTDQKLKPINNKLSYDNEYSGARLLAINENLLTKEKRENTIKFGSISCYSSEKDFYDCLRYDYIKTYRLFPQFNASVDQLQAQYGADLEKINNTLPKFCDSDMVSRVLPYSDPKVASVRPIYENLVKALQNSPRVKFIRKHLTDEEIQNTLDLVKNEPIGSEIVHWNNKFTGME